MCGPPREQCDGFEDHSNNNNYDRDDDPGLAEERVRHLTHDENGNRYQDA